MADTQDVDPSSGARAKSAIKRLRASRGTLFGVLVYLIALSAWGFRWAGPRGTSGTVTQLAAATYASMITKIVGGWSNSQLAIARWAVGLDFVFIGMYVAAIAIACLWHNHRPELIRIGRVFAVVAVAAGLADVVENVVLLRVMSAPPSAGSVRALHDAYLIRWWLVGISAAFGSLMLCIAAADWFRAVDHHPADQAVAQEADLAAQSSSSMRFVRVTPSAADDPSPLQSLLIWLRGQRVAPFVPATTPVLPAGGRGMSFSGGGIRSAAFNLGVLQEMDLAGELDEIDYLTAVSGGSYIAGAHAILRSRAPAGAARPWARGTPEEEYLRNRTTYLAPGLVGKLDALWRLVRGLAANVTVIASVICVAGFLFGVAVLGPHLIRPVTDCLRKRYCSFVVPGWVLWTMLVTGALAVLTGGIEVLRRSRHDNVTRFLQAWSLRLVIALGIEAIFLLLAPAILTLVQNQRGIPAIVGTLAASWAGLLGGIAGAVGLSSLGFLRPVGAKPPPTGGSPQSPGPIMGALKRLWDLIKGSVVKLIVALVGPLLAFVLFLSFAFTGAFRAGGFGWQATFIFAASVMIAVLLFGDLTNWSLHPFYKRRLSSVFALERTLLPDGSIVAREARYDDPIPFTKLSSTKPELIVCAAANVSDYGATPTNRHVTPFNFSRNEIYAGRVLGTTDMGRYEETNGKRARDISVPAAVAMSGAALSPSMGKMSRWYATFLLAVANVRLGVWLPNPRAVERERSGGRRVRRRAGPFYLLWELLGRNSYRHDYIYVTDGGHYENIGLVELLRRGCTEIYCFDASGDKVDTFNTFGEAIAIARSELGVEISIDPFAMTPKAGDDDYVPRDHVMGQIWFMGDREKGEPSGRLILAKAGVTHSAPADVRSWKDRDAPFPTHGTVSQLYTEERFEAYRALGAHIARGAIETMRGVEPETDSEVSRLVDVAKLEAQAAQGKVERFFESMLESLRDSFLSAAMGSGEDRGP
jgi:hypothetical protein